MSKELKKALKRLRKQGRPVRELPDGRYVIDNDEQYGVYTPRELVAMYHSVEKGRTAWKSNVKKYDKRDRKATKQAIHHEKWDRIPSKGKVKPIDPWAFD